MRSLCLEMTARSVRWLSVNCVANVALVADPARVGAACTATVRSIPPLQLVLRALQERAAMIPGVGAMSLERVDSRVGQARSTLDASPCIPASPNSETEPQFSVSRRDLGHAAVQGSLSLVPPKRVAVAAEPPWLDCRRKRDDQNWFRRSEGLTGSVRDLPHDQICFH